jgi:hypothetical protein
MSAYHKLRGDKRRFVDLLVQRANATKAIREIKPWIKRPDVLASQWKSDPNVIQALAEREAEAMDEAGIRNATILIGLARVAHVDIREFFHADGSTKAPHELSQAAASCVAGFEVEHMAAVDGKPGGVRYKYRLRNANEAAKLLGQYQKLWTDNVELRHSGGVEVVEITKFVRPDAPASK